MNQECFSSPEERLSKHLPHRAATFQPAAEVVLSNRVVLFDHLSRRVWRRNQVRGASYNESGFRFVLILHAWNKHDSDFLKQLLARLFHHRHTFPIGVQIYLLPGCVIDDDQYQRPSR